MYWSIRSTWWLGDAVGAVVVTPFLLLWRQNPRLNWTRRQAIELAVLFPGLFFTAWIVFGGRFHSALRNYPLEYLCNPFLIWAAFRFGRQKTATAICVLAAIAAWGTLHGFGPFARESQNMSLLLLQTFVGIIAVLSLVFASEVTEHKRSVERVQQMAKRFGIAVESAPNAMVMVDRGGRIALVNSQAVKMFGYNREELTGQPVEVLIPERFRADTQGTGWNFLPRSEPDQWARAETSMPCTRMAASFPSRSGSIRSKLMTNFWS